VHVTDHRVNTNGASSQHALIHRLQLVEIIDTGRKSSKGKTMREVVLDIIDVFSKYGLESAEGTNKAIEEMDEKLGEVEVPRRELSYLRICIYRGL
jgi:hypothetical protein